MRSDLRFGLAYLAVISGALLGAACAADSTSQLPDLTGLGLQTAQDLAQDRGFFDLHSEDGTGQSRAQVWDRAWTVCEQFPKPGEYDPETTSVVLTVVPTGESCL